MDQIDAKVFALITAATTIAVQIGKRLVPKLVEGREEGFAMLLPILFTVGAKIANAFAATPWVDALLWAVGGGVGAGLTHDYVMNPLVKGIMGLFGKKEAPKDKD